MRHVWSWFVWFVLRLHCWWNLPVSDAEDIKLEICGDVQYAHWHTLPAIWMYFMSTLNVSMKNCESYRGFSAFCMGPTCYANPIGAPSARGAAISTEMGQPGNPRVWKFSPHFGPVCGMLLIFFAASSTHFQVPTLKFRMWRQMVGPPIPPCTSCGPCAIARWMPLPLFSARARGPFLMQPNHHPEASTNLGSSWKLPFFMDVPPPRPTKKELLTLENANGTSSPVSPFNLQPLFSFLGASSEKNGVSQPCGYTTIKELLLIP